MPISGRSFPSEIASGSIQSIVRRSSMPPTKLAHVVYQTNRMPEMRDWYATVLGGHVVYENPHLCFVTYDDEHHRVAFVDFGPLSPRAGAEVCLLYTSDAADERSS